MFSQLLIAQFLIFPNWINSVQLGSIQDVIFSSPAATIVSMNGSCTECICLMLSEKNILGVSCSQNQTCLLFLNYSLPYSLTNSPNSSFHFLSLPSEQEYSTYQSSQITQTTTSSTLSISTTSTPVCSSSCLNQTWISSSGLLAKWTFNGSLLEEMNTYNATPMNNPLFTTNGYVNQALVLTAASYQYLYTPYIPLIQNSFTIELWLYPNGFPNPTDHSILGLCTYPGNDQCLHLTIRKFTSTYYLYMSFFGDTCVSNTAASLNQWTHAAFVFDNVTRNMSIYMNGQLVGSAISALSLQGSASNVTIGYIPGIVASYGNNYFQGYIDQLTIFDRSKPACEILDDATLVTYYNFDTNPLLTDSGPNSLLSVSQSVSFVSSGHSFDAISFNDSTSYLSINGLTGLGISNSPFSISLWIRPYSLSGTLVHISHSAAGSGWCLPFIGFAATGFIVAQIWSGNARSVVSPVRLTTSVWSHIVQTWSSTHGLRLYIDNVLVASDASVVTFVASSVTNFAKLANRPNNTCVAGGIGLQTSFYGDIDDFRIYNRELDANDVCALWNY